jgi:sugar lactone lactonase YvrE
VAQLDASGPLLWTANPPARIPGFEHLAAVAVASDGGAIVLDGESGVISRFTSSGQYAGTLASGLVVYHPRGLAAGPTGDVYVADTGGSQVLHVGGDGRLLGRLGSRGTGRGELDQPTGVAVASSGDVFVVDPVARKIVRYAATGGIVTEWPYASGPTVDGPQLSLAGDGTLWASDTAGGRLQAFSLDGQPRGGYAPEAGLSQPSGVAAGDGYVIVAEPGAKRVRKLTLPVQAESPASN